MRGTNVLAGFTSKQARMFEEPPLVASSSVFGREERGVLRLLERRSLIRRREELARNLARLREGGGRD